MAARRALKTLSQTPGRRDGGLVGAWPRSSTIVQVSTFDGSRLRASDYIDVARSAKLLVDVYGHRPKRSREVPFAEISFRAADGPYTRPDTRLRGFLHYHIAHPDRRLSGGLRFRCTPTPEGFATGYDLLCRTGLPWTIPLPNLMGNRGKPITQSLLRENLVRLPDLVACQRVFGGGPHPDPVVHCPGQPWFLDMAKPADVHIPGPRGLLRVPIYPAVAKHGGLLVTFEPTPNSDEVAIRILESRTTVFLPAYAHLPAPTPGSLLVHPDPPRHTDDSPSSWKWNYNHPAPASPAASAALHCLLHGPPTPGALPSQRLRKRLAKWLYHDFPATEWEAYEWAAE